MGGGTIRLAAIGPQDFHLTANPQVTHFKTVFKRHTNFSKETKRIFFSGEDTPTFGSNDLRAVVRNEGDLLGKMFLEVTVSGTIAGTNATTVNHFGNSLLEKVVCDIGGFTVDTNYGRFYQILDELEGNYEYQQQNSSDNTAGGLYTGIDRDSDISQSFEKNTPLNRLQGNQPLIFGGKHRVGTAHEVDVGAGTYTKKFYIPLRFWFNRNEGQYLPLISIYQHQVTLLFTFATLNNLIGDNTNLTNVTMQPKLFGEFFYLDKNEKVRFTQSNHEYLIEQQQINNSLGSTLSSATESANELVNMDIELHFNHPIKFFTWAVVNEGTAGSNSGRGPCYFSSMTTNNMYGNDGNLGKVELLLEGVTLEQELPMIHYTRLLPYSYFKRVPMLDRIGVYSFALKPLDAEPSGTCNFSKLNDKNMKVTFANNSTTHLAGKNLFIYAIGYNILTITNGMAQVRYA
jgi:hypothetical protein